MSVDALRVLQVLLTAVFMLAYLFVTSLREPSIEDFASRRMAVLISFLFRHSPIRSLDELMRRKRPGTPRDSFREILEHRLAAYLAADGAQGLTWTTPAGWQQRVATYWWHVPLALVFSPFWLPVYFYSNVFPGLPYRCDRTEPTEVRQTEFSTMSMCVIASAFWLLLALWLWPTWSALTLALAVVSGVATLLGVITLGVITLRQQRWKMFWQEELFNISAAAEKSGDNSLYLRAMLLQASVSAEPNLPIPGTLAAYAAVYGTFQVLLYMGSQLIAG